MMNSRVSPDRVTVCLEGSISSVNAAAVDADIRQIIAANPGLPLCLDAEKLDYISSSGLRVLLELNRELSSPMTVKNVSPAVYQTLEVTGFTTLLDVHRKLREISLKGCRVIGRGAFGTVYRLDGDTVVKVCRGGEEMLPMLAEERERARKAFLRGVPTAIPFDTVKTEEGYGAVFELVDAHCLNDLVIENPGQIDELLERYTEFLQHLHALTANKGDLPDARDRYLEYLHLLSPMLKQKTQDTAEALLRAMPEDLHLLHGDAHWKNVMDSNGTLMLIDMETLCTGDPVFEFAGLYVTYVAFNEDDPGNSIRFHGLDEKTTETIFRSSLCRYLDISEGEQTREYENRILIPGLLRYLYILTVEFPATGKEVPQQKVTRAVERLDEAILRADRLTLRTPD